MPILFRKVYRVGPLHFNYGTKGYSSWGIKIGRWSWNSKTRANRVDLPGPLSWRQRRKSEQ